MTTKDQSANYVLYASYILSVVFLLLVLSWHLIPTFLAGLFVHELVRSSASRVVAFTGIRQKLAQLILVVLIATVTITLIALLMGYVVHFFRYSNENIPGLLNKMAEVLESSRQTLPAWFASWIPQDITEVKKQAIEWLRTHSGEVTAVTKNTLRVLAYLLIGMVLGAMVVLQEFRSHLLSGPLAKVLSIRAQIFSDTFRQIFFAQIKIALLNTIFTGLYLIVVLPLFGINLPFVVTIVLLTFLFGLLPVVGNVISNVIIVVVSLSVSFSVAISSLVFLVVIHKLEYFLNAKIIGSQTQTRAWEILIAMLVFEAVFGIAGVIIAPIYYAYLKKELEFAKLI